MVFLNKKKVNCWEELFYFKTKVEKHVLNARFDPFREEQIRLLKIAVRTILTFAPLFIKVDKVLPRFELGFQDSKS